MTQLFDLTMRDHFIGKNFTRGRTRPVRRIIVHHNAGHGIDPVQTWQTREASAHNQVWGSGAVDYIVRYDDTAWHAHEANDDSIGIEHENVSGAPDWRIADAGLHASARLVGYLCAQKRLGVPAYHVNVFTHYDIERDGVGVDTHTVCPGPYFLAVLGNPNHWYWAEARAAYRRVTTAPAPKPSSSKIFQGTPVPRLIARGTGQYLGSISGPAASHGGANPAERSIVQMLQKRLIACGYVPGITNPNSSWADGIFDSRSDRPGTGATSQAVARFQRQHMPGTKFPGQVWYDDWQKLFNL